VFATRNRALQLRYLVRLYVKELVLKNFAGLPADQLLERMIELSLYAEDARADDRAVFICGRKVKVELMADRPEVKRLRIQLMTFH
jgi:hypothetical protein